MKASKLPSVFEVHQLPKKKSCQEKRCLTDKRGIVGLFFLFILSLSPTALYEFRLRESESKMNGSSTSAALNESWTNSTSANSPMKVLFNTFTSAMAEAMSASTNGTLIHSFICNAVMGLLSLLPMISPFIFIRYCIYIMVEFYASYSYDLTVISAGKIALTAIFQTFIYFQWTGLSSIQYRYGIYLAISEFLLFYANFMGLCCSLLPRRNCLKKSLRSTLRHFSDHRNIILFQFLNYMAMSVLMAYVVIRLADFFPLTFSFIQVGVAFIIYLMHVYAKMVIILARASHKDEEAISLKTISSSMVTIGRYHLGTLISRLLPTSGFLPRYTVTADDDFQSKFYFENQSLHKSCSAIAKKNMTMFTAIHGLDNEKAIQAVCYFEQKNQLVTNFENKMSTVWTNILYASIPVAIITVQTELSLYTVEEIVAGFSILIPYIALMSTYFYAIVNTINTAENTMEFCKMIKNEDVEVMLEELERFEMTIDFEKSIVTPGADKVDEKHDTEVAEIKKKLEISSDII